MNTLKPCPFCGGTKICTEKGINLNYCDNCSAESNIEHWNTRPIEDELRARIAELEAENEKIDYFFRKLRMFCIFAHWDNPNTEAEFYKVDAEIREYLSEYKVCIDQLAVHSNIERQDDKSPNDTQTDTVVYGKESEE